VIEYIFGMHKALISVPNTKRRIRKILYILLGNNLQVIVSEKI
jgi:hypothetical protein